VAALVLGAASAAGLAEPLRQPTPAELVGSRLVVAMRGTTPSPELVERVRRGQLSGVILFARNVADAGQLRSLTGTLQRAARAGGRPPLLVCVDQEGGSVRRLSWAPPAQSAAELGSLPPAAVRRQGRMTGLALRAGGVNCDLAPVADVPSARTFIGARAFSRDAATTGSLAAAFARGLADARVLAAAKHFPGIGRAQVSTDHAAVRIDASRAALERDLEPFRLLVAEAVPIVMVSNASYGPFGPEPATWSRRISGRLLRQELGFDGVTMTDSLDAPAAIRGWATSRTAILAARAGIDLLLVTGGEATSYDVFTSLLRAARDGLLRRAGLEQSHGRITALRAGLARG
jgi:beta-N-acetylhexosaminidase